MWLNTLIWVMIVNLINQETISFCLSLKLMVSWLGNLLIEKFTDRNATDRATIEALYGNVEFRIILWVNFEYLNQAILLLQR